MKRAATAAAVIITAMVGFSPQSAAACTRVAPGPVIYPQNGTTDLPTNAVFFVEMTEGAGDGFTARLTGPQGEVSLRTDVVFPRISQLVPLELLREGETYRLEVVAANGLEPTVSTVKVGSQFDGANPPTPGLASWTHYTSSGSTCGGPAEAYTFSVTDLDEAVALRIFTGPTPQQVNFDAPTVMTFERPPALRNISSDIAVAIQSVDSAGNLSEIGPAKQIRTAGCSSVAAPPMMLLLIALLRRKRNGPGVK